MIREGRNRRLLGNLWVPARKSVCADAVHPRSGEQLVAQSWDSVLEK